MANYYGNGDDNTINGSINDDFIYGKGGSDLLYGSFGNDFINGGAGDDFLFGGDGDDILFGAKGDDTMEGGLGADQFRGGKGIDTVDYSAATSAVTAWIPFNNTGGYATGDSFVKVENLIGSAYADSLQAANGGTSFGGGGNDQIYGASYGTGTDAGVLRGDAGFDTLHMNYGETRAWVQFGQGFDTISQFTENEDMLMIDLSEFGLGGSLDANELVNSNTVTAVGGNAQFIYEGDTGRLWFDQNGTGGGGLTLISEFAASSIIAGTLDLGDFELV
ncbi:calcium-binding protein [Rhizobium sp. LjRoot254]|uniref:calcium-binding protein n=1 Tax=Rhizobium sp. LjRoot254 TaxID=3342297 RepID=UPI003ECD1667